jgi:hypothetical protein
MTKVEMGKHPRPNPPMKPGQVWELAPYRYLIIKARIGSDILHLVSLGKTPVLSNVDIDRLKSKGQCIAEGSTLEY